MADGVPTVAWLEPGQAPLVKAVADRAGLTLIGAGSPSRGQTGGVAAELSCRPVDDLRTVLNTASVDGSADASVKLVWIVAPGEFGSDPAGDDARSLLGARARSLRVACCEPIPPNALDLTGSGWSDATASPAAEALRFVPLTRFSAPFREAGEVLANLGAVRTVAVESWAGPGECSLGALLFSAMELLHAVMGEPESIDAAYVGSKSIAGLHSLPGESLRSLSGDLTANIRYSGGRAAALVLSDRAGRWNRTTTLVGEAGRLRIYDDGFELIDSSGKKVDEMRRSGRASAAVSHAVAAMSDALARLTDPAIPDTGPTDLLSILSVGQATLLSARTGQAESPSTVRRMAGVPE